jgi:nucleotide-binding universal stress UspA family protein
MKTILTLIDFSSATDPVLEEASELARAFKARIVLAHVFQSKTTPVEFLPVVADVSAALENEARQQLIHLAKGLKNDGFETEAELLFGPAAKAIREKAMYVEADFIVLGSHGHGALYDLFVGSMACNLLKDAPCPIVIVPVTGLKAPAEVAPESKAQRVS